MDAATGSDSGSTLSRTADTTLTEQLSARFAERIRQRLLAPGARLPSVRECARRHQVSPHTVVAADRQFSSPVLDTDEKFSHTFEKLGI